MTTTDQARRTAADWSDDNPALTGFAANGSATPEALIEAQAELADYPAEYAADASRIDLVALVAFLENAA